MYVLVVKFNSCLRALLKDLESMYQVRFNIKYKGGLVVSTIQYSMIIFDVG